MKCTGCGMNIVDPRATTCPYCGSPLSMAGSSSYGMNKPQQRMGGFSSQYSATASPSFGESALQGGFAPKTSKFSSEGVSVYDKNINGVAIIEAVVGPNAVGAGTGFLIDPRGYMVTNTHVVANEDYDPCDVVLVTLAGEERIPAQVIKMGDDMGGQGSGIDIALIKLSRVPKNAVCLKIGDSDKVRNGETVFCIGNSLGEGLCITKGIISDKARIMPQGNTQRRFIMSDVAVNHGNSGGPLCNEKGEVIAVIVSGRIIGFGQGLYEGEVAEITPDGMKFMIPINDAMKFVNS